MSWRVHWGWQDDPAASVTIAALRERGVKAPAQAVYDLQLLGHAIDRVSCTNLNGDRTLEYHSMARHGVMRSPPPDSARQTATDAIAAGTLTPLQLGVSVAPTGTYLYPRAPATACARSLAVSTERLDSVHGFVW